MQKIHRALLLAALAAIASCVNPTARIDRRSELWATFTHWCIYKEHLPPQARHTVNVLLTKARTQHCDRADIILASRQELSLNFVQIIDLAPIATLRPLKTLNLRPI